MKEDDSESFNQYMSMQIPRSKPPLPHKLMNNFLQNQSVNTSIESKGRQLLKTILKKQNTLTKQNNDNYSDNNGIISTIQNIKIQQPSTTKAIQKIKLLKQANSHDENLITQQPSLDREIVFKIDKSRNKLVALQSQSSNLSIDNLSEIQRLKTNQSSDFNRMMSKDFNYKHFMNDLLSLNSPPPDQKQRNLKLSKFALSKRNPIMQSNASNEIATNSSFLNQSNSIQQSVVEDRTPSVPLEQYLQNNEINEQNLQQIQNQLNISDLQMQSQLFIMNLQPVVRTQQQQNLTDTSEIQIETRFESNNVNSLQEQVTIDDVINQVQLSNNRFDSPHQEYIFHENIYDAAFQGKQLAPRVINTRKRTVDISELQSQNQSNEARVVSKDIALTIALKQLNVKEKFVKNRSKHSIIHTTLTIYREMLRINSHNLLIRYFRYRIVKLSLKIFRKYKVSKIRLPLLKMNLPSNNAKLIQNYSTDEIYQLKKQSTQQIVSKNKLIPKPMSIYDTPLKSQTGSYFDTYSIHDSEMNSNQQQPMKSDEAIFWFKQACVQIAIHALHKYQVKVIFSDSNAIINYSLDIFREMMRYNHENLLIKLVKKRIVQIALKHYHEYERQLEQETIIHMFYNKIMTISLKSYYEYEKNNSYLQLRKQYKEEQFSQQDQHSVNPTRRIEQSHRIQQSAQYLRENKKDYTPIKSQTTLEEQKVNHVLNSHNTESSQINDQLVIKVAQAFLIEYDSDEEVSTQSGPDNQSSRRSKNKNQINHERNSSINSNLTSNSIMENVIKKLEQIGNLENASIPQLRELEKQIIQSQQRLSNESAYQNTDIQQPSVSKISTIFQTTSDSQQFKNFTKNNDTNLINLQKQSMNDNIQNIDKGKISFEESPIKRDSLNLSQQKFKLNLETLSSSSKQDQTQKNSNKARFTDENKNSQHRGSKDSNERIKQQILKNYGSNDDMLVEESSQQSSSNVSKINRQIQDNSESSNRSHSSFDGSQHDDESQSDLQEEVKIPLQQLAQQRKNTNNSSKFQGSQRNSMNVPQLKNQLLDTQHKLSLRNQITNQPSRTGQYQQIMNKQLQQQNTKSSNATSLTKFSVPNTKNIKSTQFTPLIKSLLSSGKQTPQNTNSRLQSSKVPSSQLNNINFSQQNEIVNSNFNQEKFNSGIQQKEQNANNSMKNNQIIVSPFNTSVLNNGNQTTVNQYQQNYNQTQQYIARVGDMTNQQRTSQSNSQSITSSKNKEEVQNMFRMFRDLDLQRQIMIIQALEPHLNKQSKSKGRQKVEVKMKRYQDFFK